MKQIIINKISAEEVMKAGYFISKDMARLMMNYIKCSVNGNELTAVGCDGFKLMEVKVECNNVGNEDFEFYIKPFKLPKGEMAQVVITKDLSVKCEIQDEVKVEYEIEQPEEEYFDYKRVIPTTENELSICVSPKLLTSALKGYMGDKYVSLSFARKDGGINKFSPILVTTESGKRGIVLPTRGNNE